MERALTRNVHVERDTDRGEGSSRGGIRLSGMFSLFPVDYLDMTEIGPGVAPTVDSTHISMDSTGRSLLFAFCRLSLMTSNILDLVGRTRHIGRL